MSQVRKRRRIRARPSNPLITAEAVPLLVVVVFCAVIIGVLSMGPSDESNATLAGVQARVRNDNRLTNAERKIIWDRAVSSATLECAVRGMRGDDITSSRDNLARELLRKNLKDSYENYTRSGR